MLDEFITDAYFAPRPRMIEQILPRHIREKIKGRYEPRIPDSRVRCLWATTLEEHVRHRIGCAPWSTFAKMDRRFSLAAAARARRMRSNLFLYSPYAWEAFTESYRHTPKKILFQYHPHPDLEHRILREDSAKHQSFNHSIEGELADQVSAELAPRNRDCWQHADLILCASTFTRRSLLEVGADPSICKIVPYGIDLPAELIE